MTTGAGLPEGRFSFRFLILLVIITNVYGGLWHTQRVYMHQPI